MRALGLRLTCLSAPGTDSLLNQRKSGKTINGREVLLMRIVEVHPIWEKGWAEEEAPGGTPGP